MVKRKNKILIVDDELLIKECLFEVLKEKNFHVKIAESGVAALKIIKSNDLDLVITDIRMPDIDGIEILKCAKDRDSNLGVIVITACGSVESAVEAMKAGAFDYITKPFSVDELELTINKYFPFRF